MSDSRYRSLDGDHSKDLDSEQLGPQGQEVQRQRVQVSGDALTKVAEVTDTTPANDAMGLVVRLAGTGGGVGTLVDQGMPAALGNGWPVKITDGTSVLGTSANPLVVSMGVATSTVVTPVPASTSVVTLAAALPARKGLLIYNNSPNRFMYVKLGPGASTSDFSHRICPNGAWDLEKPIHPGDVTAVWSAGSGGTAQITELS